MSGFQRRLTKIAIAASLIGALQHSTVVAQTMPELFQKLKSDVHAGSWAEALRTLGTLQTEAAKPGNEDSRAKLEGPIAFYRGVCEANLGQSVQAVESFVTFLDIRPNATLDSAAYSKETVAAFEEARTTVANRSPSLAVTYRSFEPPPEASGRDPADKFWADGPVRWILTDEEKKEWSSLAQPNTREAFVERFWRERSTLPGSSGRTYREEFERRVAFADAYLAQEPEQRGKSDRPRYGADPPGTAPVRESQAPAKRRGSERAFRPVQSRVSGGEAQAKRSRGDEFETDYHLGPP